MQNEFDIRNYIGLLSKYKRLFVIVALVVMTGAVVASYLLPKKYMAQSVLYVSRNVLNNLFREITATPSVEETLRGLNSAIKSRTIMTKVISDLDLNLKKTGDTQMEAMIFDLQKKTDVRLETREGLVTITFTDENPRIARDFVNTLVRRFIEEKLTVKREESYGASSFLSQQIADAKGKLDKIEGDLNALRRDKGAALATDPVSSQGELAAAQQRLDDLVMRRSQLEAARNQLRSNSPARARLVALQRRLAELRVEYTDNYPEVLKVKADIEAAQRELGRGGAAANVSEPGELARVEAELSAVRMSEANQRAMIATTRGLMRENPVAKSRLDKLEEERNSYKAIYDQMVARHGQAEVIKQMEVQDKSTTFRIVEPAVMPVIPVSPNRIMIILGGIAAGIAAGFLVLLGIDRFDHTVKGADALKSMGIQVLAIIPKISDPGATEMERKKNRRLYLVAGTYFCLIIALLGLEAAGLSPVDKIIGLISG